MLCGGGLSKAFIHSAQYDTLWYKAISYLLFCDWARLEVHEQVVVLTRSGLSVRANVGLCVAIKSSYQLASNNPRPLRTG